MRKIIASLLMLVSTISVQAQVASRLLSTQAVPSDTNAYNFVYVDTTVGNMQRFWVARSHSLKILPKQIKWGVDTMTSLRTSINTKLAKSDTTNKWKPIGWNPTWINVSGKPVFANVATSGSYNDLSNTPNLSVYYLASNPNGYISSVPVQSFASITGKPTTLSGYGITDAYPLTGNPAGYISSESDPTFNTKFSGKTTTDLTEGANQYFTNTRARASISAGTGISYNNSTGVITNNAPDQTVSLTSGTGISVTGTYPSFTITNSIVAPSLFTNVNRTLNSNFIVSTTKEAFVKYDVTLQVSNPLIAGVSTADAYLEYSTNGGTNWITLSRAGNSSGVGLAVAIAITNTQTVSLVGWIPSNALTRIRSVVTGTGVVTFVSNSGQERY